MTIRKLSNLYDKKMIKLNVLSTQEQSTSEMNSSLSNCIRKRHDRFRRIPDANGGQDARQ